LARPVRAVSSIAHFVMAITSVEAVVRHAAPIRLQVSWS
jgi:hypothetical protein